MLTGCWDFSLFFAGKTNPDRDASLLIDYIKRSVCAEAFQDDPNEQTRTTFVNKLLSNKIIEQELKVVDSITP